MPLVVLTTPANILEGTPFHDICIKNGWLNENGESDCPNFPNGETRAWTKRAYRLFHLSPRRALKCFRHPYQNFLGRFRTMTVTLPAMLWKRW